MPFRSAVWFVILLGIAPALSEAGPLKIQQNPQNGILLENGTMEVRVHPDKGDFSLSVNGTRWVNQGYWSQVGRRQDGRDISRLGSPAPPVITQDPAKNNNTAAEVSLKFAPAGSAGGLPCEVEMRYTLTENKNTLYITGVWRHGPGMPGFTVGEARHAMKLDGAIFDYLAIDEKRHGPLPSGEDWDLAEPLNLKEARRIVTGPFAGKAEHKYGYSALIAETPAYGWASTKSRCGLWLINPSSEYLAGGPTKMELTGHLDVNREGTPVLLNMWHGSHYGGSALTIAENEVWTKVIGPFAIHCNEGEAPESLWEKATAAAAEEHAAWPFSWLNLPEYPLAAERASATGKLVIKNPASPPGRLRVGLTAPVRETISRRGRKDTVDWQRNSRDYQFWTIARPDGTFTLPNLRAGNYTLHAFADGIPGEFARTGVVIASGAPLDLGTLTWKPEEGRRCLWQIGIADRSAAEFRRGAEAETWGTYYQFPKDFPDGVDYTIGKSDWTKDWNYAQCGISREGAGGGGSGGVTSSAWNVNFDLPEVPAGAVSLRLGICGNRSPSGVFLTVNGKPSGGTGPLPDSGVMHRDAARGAWLERSLPITPGLLKTGTNTLTLTLPVNSLAEGVLYDFVRLEAETDR